MLYQVRWDAGFQFPPLCVDLIRPLPASYSRKQVILFHETPDTLAVYVSTAFLRNKPGHWSVTDTAFVIVLNTAYCICDFSIGNRTGIAEVIVIALPGYIRNAAKEAHISDASSEDFVDGPVLDFFLKPATGVPLISINASR